MSPFPVDVVWTYCSPKSNARKNDFAVKSNELLILNTMVDDIKYSLRSVATHMPWFNHIYIVISDDDVLPKYVRKHLPDLTIVKHSQIIPKKFLPTFNPNVIESYIHRIKDLTEHFVYCNDDTFVCKPTSWKHFFTASGMPINRHYVGPTRHSLKKNPILFVQMMQHAIAKYSMNYTRYQHQIYPYKKSLIQEYEKRFENELKKASFHRFRNPTDFNLLRFSGCFASTEHKAKILHTDDVYDFFVEANDIEKLSTVTKKTKPRFLCINNTSPEAKHVYTKLEYLFPFPSPFEKKRVTFV